MRETNNRNKLIRELLKKSEAEFNNEEFIHKLIDQRVTDNVNEQGEALTRAQIAADRIARFTGSWTFISIFIFVLIAWMALNVWLAQRSFDAYPFILLNLVLSCVAAIQAPLILMSQNRQETKDRIRSENDYKVNLKSEIVIDDLHHKMDQIIDTQKKMLKRMDAMEKRQAEQHAAPLPAEQEKH